MYSVITVVYSCMGGYFHPLVPAQRWRAVSTAVKIKATAVELPRCLLLCCALLKKSRTC